MTTELSSLGRLRCAIESGVANYAVDQSASPSNFIDVPVIEGSVQATRNEDKLDPQTMQTTLDDHALMVRGVRSCGLNFSTYLAGTGTPLTGGVSAATTANCALVRLVSTMMGGLLSPVSVATVTVDAGGVSTATRIYVTEGSVVGGVFTSGGVIGCTINGRVEAREIIGTNSAGADYVDVKIAFSGTPANGSAVYTGLTLYLTENPLDSLQFLHDGMEDYDKFVLGGLQGGFDLDITPGQLAKISPKLSGAYWAKLSNSTIAAGSASNVSPASHMDDELILGTVGSTTRTVIHTTSETWTPNITYIDVPSTAANNGSNILRKRRGRSSPSVISGKFTVREDHDGFNFDTADSSRSVLGLYRQIGSVPGSIVLLSAPTIQVKTPQKADANGLAAREIEWVGRNDVTTYTGIGTNTGYRSSALKIHLL